MSAIATGMTRRGLDHFEPEVELDPTALRKLRGHLEQIDYAAYAANREIVSKSIGHTTLDKFKHLAIAAAHARVKWVTMASALTATAAQLTPDQISQLSALRKSFEELTEAYEAMRRMVERGYLAFQSPA